MPHSYIHIDLIDNLPSRKGNYIDKGHPSLAPCLPSAGLHVKQLRGGATLCYWSFTSEVRGVALGHCTACFSRYQGTKGRYFYRFSWVKRWISFVWCKYLVLGESFASWEWWTKGSVIRFCVLRKICLTRRHTVSSLKTFLGTQPMTCILE